MVIDSTDRDRLALAKEELYKMLAHEVLSSAHIYTFARTLALTHMLRPPHTGAIALLESSHDVPGAVTSHLI